MKRTRREAIGLVGALGAAGLAGCTDGETIGSIGERTDSAETEQASAETEQASAETTPPVADADRHLAHDPDHLLEESLNGGVSTDRIPSLDEPSLAGLDAPDLVESGFEPRATERDTPAGAVDVYGVDADGNTVVVELKRRRVGPDAVGQLSRYVEALRRDGHAERRVRGVLVAPSVTDRARDLLTEEGLKFVALEPTPE